MTLATALVLVAGAGLPSFAQTDPTEILDRAIDRLGGEAFLGVTDVVAEGRFYQFQRGELSGGDEFRDLLKFPDKERTELGKDGDVIRINNGEQGWNVDKEEKTVEEQIPTQIALFREELKVTLDHLLRVVLPSSTATLQYVGRDMLDFSRVDVLEIRDEDRTRISLYVDRSDGLILKKSVRRLSNPQVLDEVYSNYHDIDGVFTPLLVTRYTDGVKTMEIRYDSVTYNSGLEDALFMPEDPDD
jgi:hypothetical protein